MEEWFVVNEIGAYVAGPFATYDEADVVASDHEDRDPRDFGVVKRADVLNPPD